MGYKHSVLHNRIEHNIDASFGQLRSELTELTVARYFADRVCFWVRQSLCSSFRSCTEDSWLAYGSSLESFSATLVLLGLLPCVLQRSFRFFILLDLALYYQNADDGGCNCSVQPLTSPASSGPLKSKTPRLTTVELRYITRTVSRGLG